MSADTLAPREPSPNEEYVVHVDLATSTLFDPIGVHIATVRLDGPTMFEVVVGSVLRALSFTLLVWAAATIVKAVLR